MGKKKRRNSKEVGKQHELPGGFWRQIFAILMIALAIMLVLTWFGSGGSLLNTVHSALLFAIGFAVYLLPPLLVLLAISIFKSDDNKLPITIWIASLLLIAWFAGAFGVPTIGETARTGGILGEWLGSLATQILDRAVAIFIFIVLIFITTLFVLSINAKTFFKALINIFRPSKRKEDEKNARIARDLADDRIPEQMKNLKVNPGVAVANTKREQKPEKPDTPKSALVSINDPDWKMPPSSLLETKTSPADAGNLQQNALVIKNTLSEFGIEVDMEGANIGPRVTQYTMRPPSGVKTSKIPTFDRDLSLNLAKDKIRIEAPIPGTNLVGVEIPNNKSADVRLRGIIDSDEWKSRTDKLTFAVGRDISGTPVVGNLAGMPHLLIAGTTGSGKSVMMNTLITSLLYRNSPSDMKLIIIDPKQVEMVQYEDIPHLITPVITSVDKALSALKYACNEMDRRYAEFKEKRAKNINDYNAKMEKSGGKVIVDDEQGNPQKHDGGKMPYIIVIVDEMADLMMMAGKDLEYLIVRVAQKGRAAGIHLVLATQRPEVKVVTGLIKANIPGRIAFAVNNNIDSRVMLDLSGAEKLLGAGDMLFLTTEMMGKPRRVQGAFVSDDEINKVCNFLRDQSEPQYDDDVISQHVQIKGMPGIENDGSWSGSSSNLHREAMQIGLQKGELSVSLIQKYCKTGYQKASTIMDELEEMGCVGPKNGQRPREILISSLDEMPE